MEHFSQFNIKKEFLVGKITLLKQNLSQLGNNGFDCSEGLNKLDEALKSINEEHISVVLVGAFSDGKTSVIAGWLGKIEENMKIDSDESSDELAVYHLEGLTERCDVIDTPGLFGSKEKINGSGNSIRFEDITKKYIDQANIIIYVVEAKNPIKESHVASLKWILKDLGKASTVIFVINKMDMVADLTDDEEFNDMAKVKIDSVREKLKNAIGLSDEQLDKIKIVAISSNPEGKGQQYWEKHRMQYIERSRMMELERASQSVLSENSMAQLINKTNFDVLKHILNEYLAYAKQREKIIAEDAMPEKEASIQKCQEEMGNTREEILKIRPRLRQELQNYQVYLNGKVRGLTFDNAQAFIEDDLQQINNNLDNIFEKYFQQIMTQMEHIGKIFFEEAQRQNIIDNELEKRLGKGVSQTLKTFGDKAGAESIKTFLLVSRDLLKKIGVLFKFKPWQVTKYANFLNGAFPYIGTFVDLVMSYKEARDKQKRQQELKEFQVKIKKQIDEIFDSCYDSLKPDEKYFENYAANIEQYDILLKKLKDEKDKLAKQNEDLKKWIKESSIIEAEFQEIK
ncbi:MAG: dynamin family protein [Acidaminococcaceae bacterium]|jgi:predicted GTPase|nr:dynamin family protein [Acidaminococcaceae bacterium]